MPPEASTQEGDGRNLSVEDAANVLLARRTKTAEPEKEPEVEDDPAADLLALEAEALGEDPNPETESDPDEVPEQEASGEEEMEEEPTGAEAESLEASQFEFIDEVAEAAGLSLEDFLSSVKSRTRIDGEDSEVSLADLLKGHQLESSFTRKNQQWLETQKTEKATMDAQRNTLQDHFNRATVAFNLAQEQLTSDFQNINWTELQVSNQSEYLLKRQQFGERQQRLNSAVQQASVSIKEAQDKQASDRAAADEQHLETQHQLLMDAVPEWKNETKRDAEAGLVGRELKAIGYTDAEVSELKDHRLIILARKALGLDGPGAKKLELAKKQVHRVQKLVKPGSRKPTGGTVNKLAQAATAKAKRTGSADDVAEALIARRNAKAAAGRRRSRT
jgi:hypothetical protein